MPFPGKPRKIVTTGVKRKLHRYEVEYRKPDGRLTTANITAYTMADAKRHAKNTTTRGWRVVHVRLV